MGNTKHSAVDDDILVCVYEDGERTETPYHEWLEANSEDPFGEIQALLASGWTGETVTFGGGASPLCQIWIECGPSDRAFRDHGPRQERSCGLFMAD